MAGPVEDKFKKMQDEMSRFEEEIGLPLPSVPLPPNEPMPDTAPPLLADLPLPALPLGHSTLAPPVIPNSIPPPLGPSPLAPPPPPPQFAPPPIMQGEGDFGPPMFGAPLPPMPHGMGLPPIPGPPMAPGGLPHLPPMPPGGPMPPMPPVPPMPGQGLPHMPMPMSLPGGRMPMPTFQPPQNMMGPPNNMFPVVSAPQVIEEKITPAIVSATPMLYVANPQLEIAAIQAERTISLEEPQIIHVERKAAQPKLNELPPTGKKRDKKNRKCIRTAGGTTWEDGTLAEWDDDDFRLFCGDLGNDVTDEVLSRAFSKYASFVKAKVIRDKRTNKTKGFGFVSFKDPQDFIRATKEMNGRYVGSRPIKLRKSTWKNRCLDVVRKKDKEKQQLISMLTGR